MKTKAAQNFQMAGEKHFQMRSKVAGEYPIDRSHVGQKCRRGQARLEISGGSRLRSVSSS
jgi:hypothetical protein